MRAAANFRGAHAPRVRARRLAERTFFAGVYLRTAEDFGEAPKSAREARALPRSSAFTLIELLIVMAIIIVLAGLILATANYVQKKGYRSRAEAEIAAISAALENYKADNGVYPRDANTDALTAVRDPDFARKTPPDPNPTSYDADPRNSGSNAYKNATFSLYQQLSGNLNGDRSTFTGKGYFQFKPNMLYPGGGAGTVAAVIDPFGNAYGYSTAKAKYNDDPAANPNYGFNPTFDCWSTAGTGTAADAAWEVKWIKNW